MAAEVFSYHRNGRNTATIWAVLAVWGVLLLAIIWVDAALWLMGIVAAFTLPALWDLWANPAAGLSFDDQGMTWFSAKRSASLRWSEVDHMRLDTRLDFSVRATAVLNTGQKIRLPYEATPPHQAFENALHAGGIKTQRHHFSLIG
ncbi:hypothetical protein ROLI_011700 [Roseobacter fucihabitans]|uniref:Uncharacterized protein n=1 Tax=Roseobacter fucihabitans TaxID=1537242 RepID=A0ABZ2BQ76_9RHOB|nr:hypothetical protein [Roseobacter litoralis]MBC6964302.1 hypothetical protein [Roseobacter litoralis]